MVDYAQEEILAELSHVFRGGIDPVITGGQVDPEQIHAQIISIAKVVFLLNPGAIFYLSKLVRNNLFVLLRREAQIIEDMLTALEHLKEGVNNDGSFGTVSPSDLSNAETALLSLEFADSVVGRPELDRFPRIMDRFNRRLRNNVVGTTGQFVLTRSEAKEVLREDLELLKEIHPEMVEVTTYLRDIIQDYIDLDIPSKVSQDALSNVRDQLNKLRESILISQDEELITNSRLILLRGITSKVVVALLEQFTVPSLTAPKLTSDGTGVAFPTGGGSVASPKVPLTVQASGAGTPGYVITDPGPWFLDQLGRYLTFKIDDGDEVQADLSEIQGPGLHGRNISPFTVDQIAPDWPGPPPLGTHALFKFSPPPPPYEDYLPKNKMHLFLDSNTYEFKGFAWGVVLQDSPDTMRSVVNNSIPDDRQDSIDTVNGMLVVTGKNVALDAGFIFAFQAGQSINFPIGTRPIVEQLHFYPRNVGDTFYNDYYNTCRLDPPVKLGFKHLGAPVFFALGAPQESAFSQATASPHTDRFIEGAAYGGWNINGQNTLEDAEELEDVEDRRYMHIFSPRIIVELAFLKEFDIAHVAGTNDTFEAPADSFSTDHVGYYIKTKPVSTAERYEIVEVLSDTQARIDVRGINPATLDGTIELFGSRGDYTQFTFSPDLLADTHEVGDTVTVAGLTEDEIQPHGPRGPFNIPDTVEVTIGPSIKTTSLPADDYTISTAIAALEDPANGSYDQTGNKYAHASFHCVFKEQSGYNGKITVQGRSRFLPDELGISVQFYDLNGDLLASRDGGSKFRQFPGPKRLRLVEDSAHEVFGFDPAQKVDAQQDVFLSVEELESLVNGALDAASVEADVEIVETDILTGTLTTNPDGEFPSQKVRDTTIDFESFDIGVGYLLELTEGDSAGTYFVRSSSVSDLQVEIPGKGFVGKEEDVPYRVFTRQLKISSTNTGQGSSVEVTQAPLLFNLPEGVQYGTTPAVTIVDSDGSTVDASGLNPGDSSGDMVVDSVSDDGATVNIVGGVSSGILGLRFSFDGKVEGDLASMLDGLSTIISSRNLLGKYNLDDSTSALDAALSAVISPGLGLQSEKSRAENALTHLLGVITSDPPNQSEYSATVPTLVPNFVSVISGYTAPRVAALDSLLDSLNNQRFDRALSLLVTGQIQEFFNTDHEDASFAGALTKAARQVKADTGPSQVLGSRVEEELNTATHFGRSQDQDADFSDADEGLDFLP